MCLYVTSVKLSGSRAKVNSPALGSGVMGAEMFFLRNPGTPEGFWLGPRRGRRGKTIPSVAPHKNTHQPFFFFPFFPKSSLIHALSPSFLFVVLSFSASVDTKLQHHLPETCTIIHHHLHTLHFLFLVCINPLLAQRRCIPIGFVHAGLGIRNSILCPNT